MRVGPSVVVLAMGGVVLACSSHAEPVRRSPTKRAGNAVSVSPSTACPRHTVRFCFTDVSSAATSLRCKAANFSPTRLLCLQQLRELSLTGGNTWHRFPKVDWAQLKVLRELDLSFFSRSLAELTPLHGLQELTVHGGHVTDFHALGQLAALRKLALVVHIRPEASGKKPSIRSLCRLTRLRHLRIWQELGFDYRGISCLANLIVLDLDFGRTEKFDLAWVKTLTHLRRLTLIILRSRDLSQLSMLTKLEELHLGFDRRESGARVGGLSGGGLSGPTAQPGLIDLSPLASLPRLRKLTIPKSVYVGLSALRRSRPSLTIVEN